MQDMKLDAKTGLPTIEVKIGESLVDVLIRIGFATSKREARYFIAHGAVSLRHERP
jgi:ribosomal protein S4